MDNLKSKVSIMFICIILGIVLAVQFKTINKATDNVIPSQRAQQLAIELKAHKDEKDKLLKELQSLEARLKEYEKNASEESVYVKRLSQDIMKYKILAGYEDVHGPGVVIIIDDPPMDVQYGDTTSNLVYRYDMLLEIVSSLNAAGAEAISINDQRYTNFTEIIPVGNHININGVPFVPPFVIKAIGHMQTLESALNFPGGIIWRMKKLDFDVQIKTEKDIEIPRYTKNKEFKYAKPFKGLSN
ncbi:DUF881 domain-containing protein [Caldisalinibacter kiritimatiensis]|uniref:Division initiation protein n=1 Tax=Caldisalinibacter kiritimatiensis TaxID=1304284 RepID=R1CXA9_9FIRM|nr:DUF881 domain-containing protein [Caldisalinibacter kiritimatiensis]EOD01264.1 Division initiation protein [Caldisalinibacter kiritimatiensis]